ncbi:MAG: Fe-S cluster assembly protein SufD [Ilumatobacteraceae bacterium]
MTQPDGSVLDFPTTREEGWRYTPVDEIVARLASATPASHATAVTAVSRADIDALAGGLGGPRLVLVNGIHDDELSDLDDLPGGLQCGIAGLPHCRTASGVAFAGFDGAVDGFLARNHAGSGDIAIVVVDAGAHIGVPLHIVHLAVAAPGSATGTAVHPRTIIDVGVGGHATVVETYCDLNGPVVTNASTSLHVGRDAELRHCRIQMESSTAVHVGHTRVVQDEAARLRMTSVTIGGDVARNAIDVLLDGQGSQTDLDGLDLCIGRQRHDTVVTVDHASSRCASTQRFIGVVDDHGRSSFSGEIIVQPATVATDAHQSNHNLILSVNAEADSRPWLRIFADDVRCTHGATVGRLDDEALFYLRSRGIPIDAARAMLIDAFMARVTDALPEGAVRDYVAGLVCTQRRVEQELST